MEQKKITNFFPNAVRSLLYIRFVAVAFQLWRSSLLEKALNDLLWPCPGSTTVRIWPNSQNKCAESQVLPKLVDNWLCIQFVAAGIPLWRRSSLEKGPSLTYYGPALDLPLGGFGQKWIQMSGDLSTLSLQSLVNIHQVIL